jgi:transcriptional regulator with XRE-family HTH domain
MDLREIFARNLRLIRQDRGLSQEALAELTGLDRTYISSLERGRYNASIKTIEMLAKALKVAPPRFLEMPEA